MTIAAPEVRPEEVPPLLAAHGVGVRFGPLVALGGIDLEVRPGEIVALAGENGAGKTTLVRCIAGDIAPTSGEVLLFGRPATASPSVTARAGVSVVWQDLALCDNLDVAANLLLGREDGFVLLSRPRFHEVAAALLEDLNIPIADTTRSARSLSGGQRQLLAIARAVQDDPKLLILDEPTAALGVNESADVESLILGLRQRGVGIVLVSHDVEQLFRLSDRIVVLRNGGVVAEVNPHNAFPDDVVALMSGQEIDSSARGQLTRLHGLADQLASTDRSSSLSLILSTLGAALGTERLCLHLFEGEALNCIASMGLSPALLTEWSCLPVGVNGGPVGLAAETREPVVVDDVRTSATWSEFRSAARASRIGSSWTIPMVDADGLVGVFTVLRPAIGKPRRDELDLVTLYAGYATSALERDRLFGEATTRNRVLETIREVLETLAGPVPVAEGLVLAARALREGLEADEVALVTHPVGGPSNIRAVVGDDGASIEPSRATLHAAEQALGSSTPNSVVVPLEFEDEQHRTVTFAAPGGRAALLARWTDGAVPDEATALMADAANSLRLALEREEVALAHQEAAALRRSHELQRGFLSRLSHELRTPLTAIRGYASSLMQSDVTWDSDSQRRFLTRIAAESARLGRLVGDLLDFSAIESGVLRLQRDWCDLPLVIDAALAVLPPASVGAVDVVCSADLPVVLADHDRLEQVLVNLMDNALRHNPVGTTVRVVACLDGDTHVALTVSDDGDGIPGGPSDSPFEPGRRRWTPTAGTGLGLSIAKGIMDAHGGTITLEDTTKGTSFRLELPIEGTERRVEEAPQSALSLGPAGTPVPSIVAGAPHDGLGTDG